MDGLYEVLDELCEMVTRKLTEAKEKARAAGSLSSADVEYLDRLTHTLKSIKTTMAMIDAEERGAYADGGSYRGSYRDSYADGSYNDGEGSSSRGRGRYAKRDSMGRYSSRMSGHGGFEAELHDLMADAPNEHIRQKMRELISQVDH